MSEPTPRLLILDTSGKGGLVAVSRGATVLGELRLEETRRHARDVAPFTSRLLGDQGWRPRDLDAVLVGVGPGSYTGLRVGLMAAKTLAYATGCALIGVETFAAIAQQAPAEIALVDVLADAQQERVYVQSFRRSAAGMEVKDTLRICEVTEWLQNRDTAAHVSGPGVEAYAGRLAGLPLIEAGRLGPTAPGILAV